MGVINSTIVPPDTLNNKPPQKLLPDLDGGISLLNPAHPMLWWCRPLRLMAKTVFPPLDSDLMVIAITAATAVKDQM